MRFRRIVSHAFAMFLASAALPLSVSAQPAASPAAHADLPILQSHAAPSVENGADELLTVLQLDNVATGFAVSPSGRMFLPLSHIDGSSGPQVIEWVNGKPLPYPDAGWNSWKTGDDPANHFVHVNALRVGTGGLFLWLVDTGAPGIGNPRLPHGPKIVKIDLATNQVARIYPLDTVTKEKSYVDDIRFHGSTAYITDAGDPGVIILNLDTGTARRVLDDDPSTTAQRPITADDHVLRGPDGNPVKVHADQLEVSPDGRFFFYQPASGPMSRVATRYLDDPKLSTTQLAKHITTYAKTGSTGGTAIDAAGIIYCSDTNKHRIITVDTEGHQSVLLQDPRLLWVDSMWIDGQGYLYMPAAQLDRMAPFNGGVSKLKLPISIYKLKINAKPPANDHP